MLKLNFQTRHTLLKRILLKIFFIYKGKIDKSLPVSTKPNPLNFKATMWLYRAQNVVNIPLICSYNGELICPQMPQNEERNYNPLIVVIE